MRACTSVYARPMIRRAQQPITIRSDRAAARLKLLTRGGRSQAQVIEEALDAVPVADTALDETAERAATRARLNAIIDRLSQRKIPSMAEIDAREYNEHGNPR